MSTAARDISESAGLDAVSRGSRTSLPERYERWREAFDNGVESSIHPGAQVLDVGSGREPTVPWAVRPAGCKYVGLDLSAAELERAPSGSYDETVVCDITEFRPELRDRFDLVMSFQVFEHVRPLSTALQNIRTYLKSGGVLVAIMSGTFAEFALASRVIPTGMARRILKRTMGKSEDSVFPAHYDRCWYGALRSELRDWTDVEITPLYVGGLYLAFAPALQAIYLKYEEWAMRGGHRNLASHYVVCARRPAALGPADVGARLD